MKNTEMTIPHDLTVEENLLGCVLFDPNCIYNFSFLEPQHFYFQVNQVLFREIQELLNTLPEGMFDIILLNNHLENQGKAEAAGGISRIFELYGQTLHSRAVVEYATIVYDLWKSRQLIKAGEKVQQIGFDYKLSWEDKVDLVERHIQEVVSYRKSLEDGYRKTEGMVETFLDNITTCRNTELDENIETYPTGYYDIDALVKGFKPTQLWILAALTGMGKTALAVNIAINYAKKGIPVIYYTPEVGRDELFQRMVAVDTEIENDKLENPKKLSDEDVHKLEQCRDRFVNDYQVSIDDKSFPTPQYMRSEIKRYKKETGQEFGIIVLDHISRLLRSQNFAAEITVLINEYAEIAKETGWGFLCLSQLNREVSKRNNKRPELSDLKDSGSLEQTAHKVLFIHNPNVNDMDNSDCKNLEVIVAKNRNGASGTAKLLYVGSKYKFLNSSNNSANSGSIPTTKKWGSKSTAPKPQKNYDDYQF